MTFIYLIVAILVSVISLLLIRKYTSLEFVSHAKLLFKAWSVWLSSAGTLLGLYLLDAPDALLGVWRILPDDLKSVLPVNFSQYLSYVLIALGVIAQFIRQNKLLHQKNQMEAGNGASN